MEKRLPLIDELDALFCGLWPGRLRDLFDPDDPKPLAIGIHKEIGAALGMTPEEERRLGVLLARWTGRMWYAQALRMRGAMRHGIDGQPVEAVSREDVASAHQRIHRMRLKRERRQAEQERIAAEKKTGQAMVPGPVT